ncbi:MAG TPA: SpoIIE family protein phosphatase [Actinocrinis sp.]|nr:SpoIIE family protein phosphatase [Actinocrinis sp.]
MTPDPTRGPRAEARPVRPLPEGDADVHRILLIEDDAGDALLVEELLADTGLPFTLRWKQTLAQALADLAEQSADCVLLDLNLPDASGTPFISAVQQACPAAAVIVLTGLADSRAGIRAVANGAQDYLLKGQIDAALLHRSIRYAVQRKQAEQASAELRENQIRAQENRRLERGLLPAPLLAAGAVTATTRYLPAREGGLLGGDFLDAVQTGGDTVHAIIGDVSGHGPDEAALGVCLRIAWRALTLAGHGGIELLDLLEQVLVAERPSVGMFATCSIATLDLSAGRATVYLAGHHEPLLTGPGGPARQVPARHGMALGILPGRRAWHPTEVSLPSSGALLMYTDGLIEGYSGAGPERLGVAGLIDLIAAAPTGEAEPLLDHLMTRTRDLNAERHADDLAVLRLAWHSAGGSGR